MKANIKLLRKKRFYSQDFKKELVAEFESGQFSVPQLEKLHGISNPLIYNWIYKFSTFNEKGFRVVEMNVSSENKLKQLEDRVKELEGAVGRKQIQLDYLEKIIDLAKSDLDIDIKKLHHPAINWFCQNKKDMNYSMNHLYRCVGITKQGVYQYVKRQAIFDQKLENLVIEADELREEHPGCGVSKMYNTLKPDFIGRDRFVEAFMELGYRIKRSKNYRRTTFASSVYYPNLIKGMVVFAPSMIWQSDITYIKVGEKFYYAVFIIDVYTKNIVGHNVSDHMRATANVKALKMAFKFHDAPKIHHSDRGGQYIYKEYISLLRENDTEISMALSAQDNAYAERINRTIKEEYLDYWKPSSFDQLKRDVKKAVYQYNNRRPHNNLNKKNPVEFENYWTKLSADDRPRITIFNNEINV